MKQKKIVRAVCLFLAILMVVSVMGSVLVTMASAATVKRKNTVYTARQPDLTFYDIDGNLLGTFSHSAKSDLIGFNSTRVIYKDEEGQEIETNYGRVDVTLHLSDGTGKYSTMTQTREDSYYLRYNMGSTTGEAFSNRITCSKGSDDVIDLDIELPNVVFRDSNEMKMNVIFQYPSVRTSTSGKKTNVVKTRTTAVNFTFTKAKLDLTVTKPNNPLTDDEKDKEKDKTLSGTIREYNSDGTLVNKQSGSYNEQDTEKPETEDGENQQDQQNPNNPDSENNNNNNNGNNNNGNNNNGNNNNNGTGGNNENNNNGNNGDTDKPDTPENALFETPYLLLQEFSTGGYDQVAAGSDFPLTFLCRNTSQQIDLENIILKVAPSEGLQIVDGTNVFFLPIVNKSDTFEKTVNIAVLPNAEAKSHAIDISMSYEYVLNGARQKGEMTQQVAVQTMQPDRFSADPVSDLLETTVGEEIYITGKYVNKSRGEIYNLSATLVGDFNGAGKIEHVGNVAAGASGEVEFSFTPDTAGPLKGEIAYSYEDAAGMVRSVSVPFSTTITEATMDDMMTGMGMGGEMDTDGMEPPVEEPQGFWAQLKNPNSWQMWAVVGGGCVIIILVVVSVIKRKKAAAEFEDDDETV